MHPRAEWGARPGRGTPLPMSRSCRGLVVHWPGTTKPVRDVPAALRGWQNYHMDHHGWSDVAYQVAVDQAGEVWELRGFGWRSAANGNAVLNATYGAVLAVLAEREEPSPAMLAGLRAVVADWRRLHPLARSVLGHGEVRPLGTDCPGPALTRLLAVKALDPPAAPAATAPTRNGRHDVLIVKCEGRGTAILSGSTFVGLGSPAERAQADRLAAAGVPMMTVERYTWDELDKRSKVVQTSAGKASK
jgi:hypothetical protein